MGVFCSFFFILYVFYVYPIHFELFQNIGFMSKSLRVYPTNFHENLHAAESHENWYIEDNGHAEHESGFSFLITIISYPILLSLA